MKRVARQVLPPIAIPESIYIPEWKLGYGRSHSIHRHDEDGDERALTAIGPQVDGFPTVESVISSDHNHWDGTYLHVEDEDARRIVASVNILRHLPLTTLEEMAKRLG
jgi:hypothetical protein